MVKASFAVPVILFLCALPASAQHFGSDWIDRITHRLEADRGPLEERPVDVQVWGGAAYYFDDNIFLEEKNEDDSGIIIPFARARLEYQELRLQVEVDVLANENYVLEETNETGDEQRAYARIRQADARYAVEFAQLFQHVSAPLDVVFADRADRYVSDSMAKFSVDVGDMWAVELNGRFGVVRFEDSQLADRLDNINGRVDGGVVWRGPFGYDVIAQIGYVAAEYLNDQIDGAPPDAWGFYTRVGWRGELVPTLWIEALAGYTEMESDYFAGTKNDVDDSTVDVRVRAKYEVTETVNLWASYYRFFTFAGSVDPYQLINRGVLLGEAELTEQLTARARFQYDLSDSASGIDRTYFSVGGSLTYQVTSYLILDAGAYFRTGEVEGNVLKSSDYDNFVAHAGIAFTY